MLPIANPAPEPTVSSGEIITMLGVSVLAVAVIAVAVLAVIVIRKRH